MVDESGNVIASAGPTTFNGVELVVHRHLRAHARGYWLVGSDGGIFSFGSGPVLRVDGEPAPAETRRRHRADGEPRRLLARRLRRGRLQLRGHPVLRVDTRARAASRRVGPARTASTRPLWAWCRRHDDNGYFMVASDGGVFAFGDAHFAGSCPGIGGCSGAAVAVMPDASGNGYWLVTATGNIYTFGDAPYFGAPGPRATVTSAVATPDGLGYWVLLADGQVFPYGDAAGRRLAARGGLRRLRPGDGHLQHVRRRRATGSRRPWAPSTTSGRAQRRRDGGHASQRVDHRRHGF